MTRYLIKMAYDGSKYYGFQRLNNLPCVQKEIEGALKSFTKEDVKIKGAGRTDRGVHAINQCAHFDLENKIEPARLLYLLNRKTSKYLIINSCEIADNNFHARFSVKTKTYMYKINTGKNDPFKADYYLYYDKSLNVKKLKEVAKIFKGIHNFKNFVSGQRDNYESIIYDIKIIKDKDIITIYFKGKSFYRYMIRNLVGAMLDYNVDKVSIDYIKDMLNIPNEEKQLTTASSEGLYLIDVEY